MLNAKQELERLDRVIIASEDWAKSYKKDKLAFAKLIKLEAKLIRALRAYFKLFANERVELYINWEKYYQDSVKAYNVNITVDVEEIDDVEYDEMLRITHEPLLYSIALGAQSAEKLYNIDLGLNEYNSNILQAAERYTADLVKGVTNTTKDRISQSIKTSVHLGEDKASAVARLRKVINDPRRAEMIARTETVRSFSKGITTFGKASGATSKSWEISSAPCAICAGNEGITVGVDEDFPSGDSEPPAHPNAVFAGTTFVPYGELEEMVSADYDGPAIKIETSENNNITIGPNHPMLTQRGLVKASELTESDYLVYDMRVNNMPSTNSHDDFEQIPMLEDVFHSVISNGGKTRVTTTADNLHGDRVFCKGEINVVIPTNRLLFVLDSCGIEEFREGDFMGTDMQSILLSSSGSGNLTFDTINLSTSSCMSSALSCFRFERIRFIHTVNYTGKAYDSTTQSSLYNSNGFVVSNCRCGVSLTHDYSSSEEIDDL